MALTASEEALVRQLLDQQAAILSLAGNEATITSKLGATKVTLSDLVAVSAVADADLLLMRQGTNDKSVTADKLAEYIALQCGTPTALAGGTADAITANFTPDVALANGTTVIVRASAANGTTTPTFAPDSSPAKTIVKGNNLALAVGDIAGAGHWFAMNFDATLDKWVLANPAHGVVVQSRGVFMAHDEKPSGTNGGSSIAGIQTRTLNTLMINTIAGASLDSNNITLPAGTYRIRASCPAQDVNPHKALLHNISDNITLSYGTSENATDTGSSDAVCTRSFIQCYVTLAAPKVLCLKHYTRYAVSGSGLGTSVSSGYPEVYSVIEIIKEA